MSKYDVVGGVHATGMHDLGMHFMGSKGPSGFGSTSTAEQAASTYDGTGKVVIITGASAGLGLESSRVLAARGCDVIMAVRNVEKANARADKIRQQHPDAKLIILPLDLTKLQSVRDFVAKFVALNKPLHTLLLNAGIMATPPQMTADGYEAQFQTNFLSQFLLTELLTPLLIKTAKTSVDGSKGRIVVVSSAAHFFPSGKDPLPFSTFETIKGYQPWAQYGRTKLCNVLMAREYNVRHKGEPVEAVTLHPGGIMTELSRDLPWYQKLAFPFFQLFMKTIPQGAATQVYLATAPTIVPGAFYADVNIQPSSAPSQDAALGAALWDWAVKHVGR